MTINVPSGNTGSLETRAKVEVLKALEPQVEKLMARHLNKQKLWFPSDFLPADEQMDEDEERALTALRERARGLPDEVRVAVTLNLLTEEGLPHFHRVLAVYLGEDNIWSKWNYMWTAEEDRHGVVIHDYARDARLVRMRNVEMMQYAYVESGFTPDWDKDPYRVFVYTTLQERATQYSHRNTGKLAGTHEPTLDGILASVAADEAKHFTFYREVFKSILKLDPNRALQSALAIMPSLEMPGVSMPMFREMADVVRRAGIYGPWDYRKIVQEAIDYWKLPTLTGLSASGRETLDKILKVPDRLRKVAEYIERRSEAKSFSFDFNYDRIFHMA